MKTERNIITCLVEDENLNIQKYQLFVFFVTHFDDMFTYCRLYFFWLASIRTDWMEIRDSAVVDY